MNILEEDLNYIVNYDLPYERLKGHTVLVTGATGLIGASLVRALLAIGGIRILAFVRDINKANNINKECGQLEYVIGDIINPIVIEESVDYIFHCASVTESKIMIEKPVETIIIAVEGTRNILELAKNKNIKSVVYVSSMEMYGAFDESDHEVTESFLYTLNRSRD